MIVPFLLVSILSISEYIWLDLWIFVFGTAICSRYNNKFIFVRYAADLLSSKVFVWLGSVSYSLYLVHEPIVWLCVRVGKAYHSDAARLSHIFLVGFFSLFLSLILSHMLFIFVERPAIAFGKRIST